MSQTFATPTLSPYFPPASITPVSATADKAVVIRQATVNSLLAYNTIAGQNVEDMRQDDIPSGDMPRIVVRGDEDREGTSQAGTDPKFDVTMDLLIECYAERAAKDDVVSDVDTMIAQVLDCLLCDPNWVSQVSQTAHIRTRRRFRRDAQMFLGEGQILLRPVWRETYQPRITQPLQTITLTTNARIQPPPPLIGAIRFDGWYIASSTAGSVNAQLAAALSPSAYNYRLPWFATVTAGVAAWPAATQATIDAEITAAASAGLGYWAFDSYQPTDEETVALNFYLSSSLRKNLKFCMLGQFSNWNLATGAPYSAAAQRDVGLFSQAGYVQVLGNRPLYYVLAAGTNAQMTAAVAWIRSQAAAAGLGNPYIVALSGASITDYNNVTGFALSCGFDAAGAYSLPELNGTAQPYANLVATTEADWTNRAAAPLPMIPTAMTDFDPRPLIQTPQPFYDNGTIPAGWNLENYYNQGTPSQVAQHVADMANFIIANAAACPAGVGLIYAWNELTEGGPGLMQTYLAGYPAGQTARQVALGQALQNPTDGLIQLNASTITLPI